MIQVQSSGNPLPAATVVGAGGLTPPGQRDRGRRRRRRDGGSFDPASDGIDFWESLEGMRVQLNDAVAVGPTNSFGETPVAPDNGVRRPCGRRAAACSCSRTTSTRSAWSSTT